MRGSLGTSSGHPVTEATEIGAVPQPGTSGVSPSWRAEWLRGETPPLVCVPHL